MGAQPVGPLSWLRVVDLTDLRGALCARILADFDAEVRRARDLTEGHPHLVHVALADLGLSGPRAGWHLEPLPALAASGALWASGFPDLPPCNGPGHPAHDCASVYGAIGAVAAVLDRARGDDRTGQLVEV